MKDNKMIRANRFREITKKFFENTLAYAIPVLIQQFILYPLIARKLGADANGLFLSLLALNYFVINITATVLVNTRLLQNEKYNQQGLVGDFNFLLLLFAFFDVAFVIVGTLIYTKNDCSVYDILLSTILVLLFLYHDYIVVQYRIELKFRKILINNLILSVGYIFGLAFLYFIADYWQLVFIIPYLMTMVYDLFNTNYIHEPLRVTPLFNDTVKHFIVLFGATLLHTAVTYGDRLLLYPLMDGTSVSVFSSAQLIGKMMQMISTPISTFVLAYIMRREKMSVKVKPKDITIGIVVLAGLYFVSVLISKPLIHFLYPAWAVESLKYVRLTALNGILLMLGVIVNVFVLRFCDKKYQIITSALYLLTYIGFSFTLVKILGLWGFCLGNLIASISQLIFLLIVLINKKVVVICIK